MPLGMAHFLHLVIVLVVEKLCISNSGKPEMSYNNSCSSNHVTGKIILSSRDISVSSTRAN